MATSLIRHPHGMITPAHGSTVMGRLREDQHRHLRHKSRHGAEAKGDDRLGQVIARTAGVSGTAFVVGLIQGHYGTSKLFGAIPGELLVGAAMHGVSMTSFGRPFRSALRAVGDGALAAGAVTLGYGLGAKTRPEEKKSKVPAQVSKPPQGTGVHGEEPPVGGAALSDEELARFANRR